MNELKLKRTLEIIPGAISWSIILILVLLALFKPVICAVSVIIFDFYWIVRTIYLTTLLIMAYRKLTYQRNRDWLAACQGLSVSSVKLEELYHLVIFPVYKEGMDILKPSLQALKDSHYSHKNLIVTMAFEARNPASKDIAIKLEEEFKDVFFKYLTTFHPDNLPGEKRANGANATWAAKKSAELLRQNGIPFENVIISCFDADTCVDKEYFGCLSFHFLTNPKPHQASYQPMPVYNNNIWYAPSFARLVEMSASFCQLIESMRLEKFVTFSSHSMSFKTLVDIDYWPVDMVSDDSVVYWKAYLFYKGDYKVIPLYTTVSMDVAYGANIFKTIIIQYKQKRRWAWGIENFPYVVLRFVKDKDIPLLKKIRKSFHLLESHITWAVWAMIITVIAPLPILIGGVIFSQIPIGYNLPRITGLLPNVTPWTSLIWIILSFTTLPRRPKDVSWFKNITMILEWIIVPFIILILGSNPALDAQSRLMLAKYMEFSPTEKKRKVV